MIKKPRPVTPENLWNRLVRDLVYDSKQVLLYCGIGVPVRKTKGAPDDYADIVDRITRGTRYGAVWDPIGRRIHFEPDYIQNIIDLANRFDFPVFDKSFGPGGIAAFIQDEEGETATLETPNLNHILKQAMLAKNRQMPFGFVSARQLAHYEVEQFAVVTNIFDGPSFYNVSTEAGITEAEKFSRKGHSIITIHTIFESPLTLTFRDKVEMFVGCVQRRVPIMLVTQPFSGQNAPITPYGLALLAFSEFLAGMAIAYAINPGTKIINGAYPTLCRPGKKPELKLGTVVHNFTNYLIAYTSRLLDIASIQSGCTIEGAIHKQTVLDTDYETVRAMILWEDIFEGWHMLRHCYGFLDDLICFSFQKAQDDIAALRHIQSLDDNGITAVLANNVRLHSDVKRADDIYQKPTLVFDREKGALVEVVIETVANFGGDFGKHDHTLKHIPLEWF